MLILAVVLLLVMTVACAVDDKRQHGRVESTAFWGSAVALSVTVVIAISRL